MFDYNLKPFACKLCFPISGTPYMVYFSSFCAKRRDSPLPLRQGAVHVMSTCCPYSANARWRKVTICPQVQMPSGEKVVGVVPPVMFSDTAQATAWV